jgi:hypothetical protein
LFVPSHSSFFLQIRYEFLMIFASKQYGCIFHLQMESLQKLIIPLHIFIKKMKFYLGTYVWDYVMQHNDDPIHIMLRTCR